MEISILTKVTPEAIRDMNLLMHELNPDSFCDEHKLALAVDDPNTRIFVAKDSESRIVGTATLCIAHAPEFVFGSVEGVVVLSEYRGRHISINLMEALIKEASSAGVEKLHLTSRPERISANALYRKLGFVQRQTNAYEMVM